MRRRMLIKTREKVLLSILLIVAIFLLSGVLGQGEKQAANEVDFSLEDSLEKLSYAHEPVPAFSDTQLRQSIIQTEIERREAVNEQEFIKQNQIDQKDKVIYLTFDDGPSNVSDELLDILNEYDMKATFFMMGPKMTDNPEVVERKQKEGHGLALHGITHDVAKLYSGPDAPAGEMLEGQEILATITGTHTEVVRLPYGSFPYLTEAMRYELDEYDFKIWDWNVDSLDWKFNNAGYVQHTIQTIHHIEQAGETPIVLLHDKSETVKHLPKLLSYIKQQGYQTKVLTNDMAPITFPCNGGCYSIN